VALLELLSYQLQPQTVAEWRLVGRLVLSLGAPFRGREGGGWATLYSVQWGNTENHAGEQRGNRDQRAVHEGKVSLKSGRGFPGMRGIWSLTLSWEWFCSLRAGTTGMETIPYPQSVLPRVSGESRDACFLFWRALEPCLSKDSQLGKP
jgi:hypothetical protein